MPTPFVLGPGAGQRLGGEALATLGVRGVVERRGEEALDLRDQARVRPAREPVDRLLGQADQILVDPEAQSPDPARAHRPGQRLRLVVAARHGGGLEQRPPGRLGVAGPHQRVAEALEQLDPPDRPLVRGHGERPFEQARRLVVGELTQPPLPRPPGVLDGPARRAGRNRRQEVVGQLVEADVDRAAAAGLDRLGHHQVQDGAPPGRHRVVEGPLDKSMAERVDLGQADVDERLAGDLGPRQERRADRLVEQVERPRVREAGRPGDEREVELGADHRPDAQHPARLRAQPQHPPLDDLPGALGQAARGRRRPERPAPVLGLVDHPGLAQVAHELADEERVAGRIAVHLARERAAGRVDRVAGELLDQVDDVALAEPAQGQARHARLPEEVAEELAPGVVGGDVGVAVGPEDHQPAPGRRADQVPEQEQRRPVGPVQVVEDHEHRTVLGRGREQRLHGREQPVAVGVGIGRRRRRPGGDPLVQAGHQARELGGVGTQQAPRGDLRVVAENLPPRVVRDPLILVAAPVEDERLVGHRDLGRLGDQPGLADARLARDDDDLALAGDGPPPALEQCPPLVRAPDERRVRGPAQPGREGRAGRGRERRPGHRRRPHRLGQASQGKRADVLELVAGPVAQREPHRLGDEDPPARRLGAQAGRLDRRDAEVVALLDPRVPEADPDPHLHRRLGAPVASLEPLLDGDGGVERPDHAREGDEEAVTGVLDHPPGAVVAGVAEDPIVLAAKPVEPLGPEPRRERRRADQVGDHDHRQLDPGHAASIIFRARSRTPNRDCARLGCAPFGLCIGR